MNFEKFICWKSEEINSIIHTEAEATQEEVFLAIHTDNKINVSVTGSKPKEMTYQLFLDDFLDGQHGNNVQAVIEGESGSGKSHLVQWMSLNIPKNEQTLLLTIPKTQTNLYSVLKKIISFLPENDQIKYNEKLQRTETGLRNDAERINEFLSSLARTIEKDSPQTNNINDEKELIKLLPKLFDDPYFRDTYFNNHEIINNIISLIFSNSGINRNSDNRQEFKKEHLPLNAKEALNASTSTQEVLEAILDEDLLNLSLEIINRNLDKAITRTLSFSPDDLIELMSNIRSSLYQRNIELILLIEDFAQLQGVDTALLQVLTVEGSGELCKIKWAMAVTTGYFEKLEDTVRTRMTFKVNMDNPWDQKNVQNQNKYILQLGSKYLNAIRVGHNGILNWYERYFEHKNSVPNSCESCQHRTVCHEAFGEVNGIGLYPFNEVSLLKMARQADPEKPTVFRPRIFINKVLKRNLNQNMVQKIYAGEYPPLDLYDDFETDQLEFDERHKLESIDTMNNHRRKTLLELWSNSRKIVNLNEKIHIAFSIPLLSNIDQIDDNEIKINQIEEIASLKTENKIDEHIYNIEQWAKGKDLHHSTASKLRPLIFTSIVNYIQWDFLSVAKSMNILKQGNIYFVSQGARRPTSGFVLDIAQKSDIAIILKTFYYMNKEKNIYKDIRGFSKLQEQVKKWSEELINEIEKTYAPKENWDPSKASVELLTLGNLIGGHEPIINSLFIQKLDYNAVVSTKFGSLVSKITSNDDRNNLLQDILEKTMSGRKGGQKTSAFIDVKQVLSAINELKKNNWRLAQDPSLEDRKEFKDIASLYMKWKSEFNDALTEELIERFKWLDELTNRIEIEDIGVKFKNQIKNIRELASDLGISGHRSSALDNALNSCNLAQAKTAMDTTSKLRTIQKEEVFEELFPSRKNDANTFIQLLDAYEKVLEEINSQLKFRFDELNRRTGLHVIHLEIENSINKIENDFKYLLGVE